MRKTRSNRKGRKPSARRPRFDDSPVALRDALARIGPQARARLERISQASGRGELIRRIASNLPTPSLYSTNLKSDVGKGTKIKSVVGTHAAELGIELFVDAPDSPPVEHTLFVAIVTLVNRTPSEVRGTLRAWVDSAPNTSPIYATYSVNSLEPWGFLQICLVVMAPAAGINHTLKVALTRPLRASNVSATTQFNTAGVYRITVDSAYVERPRARINDTLTFGYKHGDYTNGFPLGDYSSGDTVPINKVIVSYFLAVPSDEPIAVAAYLLANNGDVRDLKAARELVGKFMIIWDPLGGIVTPLENATDISKFGYDQSEITGPLTGSVSSVIWYEVAIHALSIDCNGIVAAETIVVTGAELDANTSNGQAWTRTIRFLGTDSDTGCGRNSRYRVTRTITKVPWEEQL
jgi:hypothetical protein